MLIVCQSVSTQFAFMFRPGYTIKDQNAIHFITFSVVDWIDVFTKFDYIQIVLDSLKFCQKKKGLKLFSWVIMTNHVHFIMAAKKGYKLSNILRDFKKHTSYELLRAIEENEAEIRKDWMIEMFRKHGSANPRNEIMQFWQQDNHPKELISNSFAEQKLQYIHNNPVVAGFVRKPQDYRYSSAKDYCGEKGLLDIEFL